MTSQALDEKLKASATAVERLERNLRSKTMIVKFREESLKKFEKASKEQRSLMRDEKDDIIVSPPPPPHSPSPSPFPPLPTHSLLILYTSLFILCSFSCPLLGKCLNVLKYCSRTYEGTLYKFRSLQCCHQLLLQTQLRHEIGQLQEQLAHPDSLVRLDLDNQSLRGYNSYLEARLKTEESASKDLFQQLIQLFVSLQEDPQYGEVDHPPYLLLLKHAQLLLLNCIFYL